MTRMWRGLYRTLTGGIWLMLACMALAAHADTLELREAQAVVTVGGQTTRETVSLPYHWDRFHKGQAGTATFDVLFELREVPAVPFGLYVPRLGNAYEIWLNGTLLQQNGDLTENNGSNYANAPRRVVISPGLLGTSNVFRVHIRADVGRRGGLAPLTVGPDAEVYPLYRSDHLWRYTGSLVVFIISLLMSVVALVLWATQVDESKTGGHRRDSLYLFAGLAELSWTVNIGDALIENTPIPWPWWGMATIVARAAWMCSLALFCVEVAGWRTLPSVTWLRRWLTLLLAGSFGAATAALVYGHPLALTLLYAALLATTLTFVSLFVWKAVRRASISHRIVAAALVLNSIVGLRDWYVFRLSPEYGGNTFLRYSSVLFGLALGYIVIMRFRIASRQARDLMANMSARVAQRERELEQSYQRVEQLARDQERASERTRILRDMHDGVGAHISTAIRQMESGRATHGEVVHTLRDSLDQLKLSIDAMNLPQGDLTALLANLRYRLEPRLKACGIELQWDVDLLLPLPWLDHQAMRCLQFMVFEAISNVLQHAHAHVLRIELRATAQGGACLRVIDNGRGFDPDCAGSRGLSSLRERAAAIGARLVIDSVVGNTVVEIALVRPEVN